MQDLRVIMLQDHLAWEDREANLQHFARLIKGLERADVIALPEMFNSGFTVQPEGVAETMEGPTLAWMREQAAHTGAAITGTLIIREGVEYYNRLVWMNPNGSLLNYDKRHLFRMGGEHARFSMGQRRIVIHYKGWNIMPLICYDLRFPVWSRNRMLKGKPEYDFLLYLANWPSARRKVWQALLMARALENQCYVAGLNRVGVDGQGVEYAGDSCIISARGDLLSHLPEGQTGIISATLSLDELQFFREKFQVGLDWDEFFIPGSNLDIAPFYPAD